MNPIRLPGVILLLALLYACTGNEQKDTPSSSPFSGQLTDEEISNGRLTPEILWKLGRLGDVQLSPDGSEILYNVTRYDAATNERITDIYMKPAGGGDPVKLTDSDGSYYNPRWTADGKRIGFITNQCTG